MFRHQGRRRTFSHNLRLASNLSFVAGVVNIVGVLGLATLTTNVTGHFAYFAEEVSRNNYTRAVQFILFTLFFLFGAIFSNLNVEYVQKKKGKRTYTIPMLIEMAILTVIAFSEQLFDITVHNRHYIAYCLLFTMGLQNALVTHISQYTVRTTHLTGLFTDLGIEISQLFFYNSTPEYRQLKKRIYLRLSIILFFFLGCISGGWFFMHFRLQTLLLATFALLVAFFNDSILLGYYQTKRKFARYKRSASKK